APLAESRGDPETGALPGWIEGDMEGVRLVTEPFETLPDGFGKPDAAGRGAHLVQNAGPVLLIHPARYEPVDVHPPRTAQQAGGRRRILLRRDLLGSAQNQRRIDSDLR